MKINITTIFFTKKTLNLKVSTEEQAKKIYITCLVRKSVNAPQYSKFKDGVYLFNEIEM